MADAIQNLATNPLFNLGIGLMSGAAPGGNFAQGAQLGLMNMQNAMIGQQRQQESELQIKNLQMKQAEAARRQQVREQMLANPPAWLGQAAQPATPYPMSEQELFPGEQQIPGLMNAGQDASGLYATNPQAAGLLQDQYNIDPLATTAAMSQQVMQQMFPSPTNPQITEVGVPGDATGLMRQRVAMQNGQLTPIGQPYRTGGGITVSTGQELRGLGDQFTLDYSTDLGKRISSEAMDAPAAQRRVNQGKEYLRDLVQAGNPTGAFLPIKAEASRWLGVDPTMVQDYQMFMNLAGQEVMNTIQQTKGAVSEKEMAYFEKINIGADKDPFTNFTLMEIAERASNRKQDMVKYYPEYLAREGSGMGFEQWYMREKDPYKGQFSLEQLRNQYRQEIEGKSPEARTVAPDSLRMYQSEGLVE